MKNLKILLIEDDIIDCQNIMSCINKNNSVELVKMTNSTKEAIEIVTTLLPDAVILDLELHKGYGNGITFLSSLNSLKLPNRPYILVTTNNTSIITHEQARSLGADFIMTKSQIDYSAEGIIEFLLSLKDILIHRNCKKDEPILLNTLESAEQNEKRLSQKIEMEFDLIGISPKMIGRKYLKFAIITLINDPTADAVPTTAKYFCKTSNSVYRAMRNAIEKTWVCSKIEDLALYYTATIRTEKGAPTMTEFIFYYVNKIKETL